MKRFKYFLIGVLFLINSLTAFIFGYKISNNRMDNEQLYNKFLGDVQRHTLMNIVDELSTDGKIDNITLKRIKSFIIASNKEDVDIRTFVLSMELITNTDIYEENDFRNLIKEFEKEKGGKGSPIRGSVPLEADVPKTQKVPQTGKLFKE